MMLLMMLHIRQLHIKRNIECRDSNSFVVRTIVMQLFKAVKRFRFKVQMEFIGKEFRPIDQ